MAYSSEMPLALPPILKGTAPRIDGPRQQYRRQQRPQPKSQPFDPEDLRRRLYVVIAEREAQNEKRQRQRVDSMPAKWAQVERERDAQHLYIERLAPNATWPGPDITTPNRWPGPQPKLRSQSSLHNKLRCRTSFIGPSEPVHTGADTNKSPSTYRHIPEQAAAQFSRTTTSTGMQSDKSLVHSLSKAALRFYVEGASSADRHAIKSSITPGKQRSLLQRTRAWQDRQHGRNQFQAPRVGGDESTPWRRRSKSGPVAGEMTMTIAEEDGISALADLHLHTYRDQGPGDDLHFSNEDDNNNNNHNNNNNTLVDASTAKEHRVDWSQSDELLPHEKKGVKLPPLLRKTGSILTLKGKLGQHLRKNSADKENNKLRIVTIREEGDCDEQADADADDGSTPMSPNSGSSRSGRAGIWGRLKRS
ncbi:hypothetical protein F5B21DRAFT_505600 [Xylaria acuta]|nr:hypothetical protein F5B21DRAFT_505600 [Xylaria acuta]